MLLQIWWRYPECTVYFVLECFPLCWKWVQKQEQSLWLALRWKRVRRTVDGSAAYLCSAVLDFTFCIISSLMCFTLQSVLESPAAKPECDAGVSTSGWLPDCSWVQTCSALEEYFTPSRFIFYGELTLMLRHHGGELASHAGHTVTVTMVSAVVPLGNYLGWPGALKPTPPWVSLCENISGLFFRVSILHMKEFTE